MKKTKRIAKFRILSLVALGIFLVTLFMNDILPLRYELIIAIISLLIFAFVLYKRSRVLNIAFIILMLIPTVGLFYSQSVFNRKIGRAHV